MRHHFLITITFLAATLNSNGQDCGKAKANRFVEDLFKNRNYLSYDSTQFRGYNKELQFINTPILNKLLPDYCFYFTTFRSNYFEYFDVETALAISKQDDKKSLITHSPVFTEESKAFMNLFYGLKVTDTSQGMLLAKEIVSIFSAITYSGHFNRLINLKEKATISFELWHNDLSWRIFDFYFDDTKKLVDIKIIGGVKRQEMWPDYKRQ